MNYEINKAKQLEFKIRTLEHKLEQLQLTSHAEVVLANTHSGKIRGTKRCSVYNGTYYSFERIPYAQPPVGELRFRAPKPIAAWKNVRNCTNYGAKPMQCSFVDNANVEGTEDCLYLNVYTNSVMPTKPRPVMVWIYGGGFVCGEATREWYAPDYFMKKDIVLVTVQYRLGALGFLSLKNPNLHIPGNAGLKDQIMALKWIKRSCPRFGGDPNRITVFGEGSGATSMHLLMSSDNARGLFQRAISQSIIAVDCSLTRDTRNSYALAQAAGYSGANTEREILHFLLNCTAAQIIEAQTKCLFIEDHLRNRVFGAFGPCIEPYITQHTVLSKSPMELQKHAWGNTIPLLIGGTSNEGCFFMPFVKRYPELAVKAMETCAIFVPKEAATNCESPECKQKGLKLRKLHVKGENATIDEFYDIISHAHFWHTTQTTINERLHTHTKKTPATYLYRFDFKSKKLIHPFRLMRCGDDDGDGGGDDDGRRRLLVHGAAHTDELAYLFYNVLAHRMERNSVEYHTIKRMIGLWTTFAETGNPNGVKINDMKNIKWRPLRRGNETWKCLNISDELKFIELPEMTKLKAWKEELYSLKHEHLPESSFGLATDLSVVYAKSLL